jgi:hypothetical protein
MIALSPTRPIDFKSPVPAIPTTSVANSKGAMIILIIRRNASASGLIATPTEGQTAPMRMPITRPMKIWVVKLGSQEGREGRGGAALGGAVETFMVGTIAQ